MQYPPDAPQENANRCFPKYRLSSEWNENNSKYTNLPDFVQKRYPKNQDEAWKAHLKNQDRPTHYWDKIKRAQTNIDFAIELLIYLAQNDLLDEERKEHLKENLRAIYIS